MAGRRPVGPRAAPTPTLGAAARPAISAEGDDQITSTTTTMTICSSHSEEESRKEGRGRVSVPIHSLSRFTRPQKKNEIFRGGNETEGFRRRSVDQLARLRHNDALTPKAIGALLRT